LFLRFSTIPCSSGNFSVNLVTASWEEMKFAWRTSEDPASFSSMDRSWSSETSFSRKKTTAIFWET